METIIQIIAFLFAIFILVLMHEYGHYLIARLCNVKVLRFSIGFGKPFYSWHSKKNKTEFCLAPLFLGGYVRFLDSREMSVDAKEMHLAFDHKSILARAAIIFAGPFTNILFAFLVFWLIFIIGIKVPKPIIGKVAPQSIASVAGVHANSEIVAIDNYPTNSWKDVIISMLVRVNDHGYMEVTTQDSPLITFTKHQLNLAQWHINPLLPDPLKDLGLSPYHVVAPPIVAKILKSSAAAKAGLAPGDKILAIDNIAMHNWDEVIEYIQSRPQKVLQMQILRNSQTKTISILTDWKFGPGWKKIGFVGMQSIAMEWPESLFRERQFGPLLAVMPAIQEMWSLVRMNGIIFSKLVTGKISLRILGGPLSIYQASSKAVEQGSVSFLGFLGLISLTLAFVNLFPLPGLDGGYFIFLLAEAILRRPISLALQVLILRLGMIALLMFFLQATINDVMRLF